jgi:hypothetical protein
MAEIIDISDLNETSSSNFGGGMELLMNKSHTSKMGGGSTNIGLSDLDDLENELNDLGNVHSGNDFNKPSDRLNGVSFQPSRDDMDDTGSVHLNIHDDHDIPLDLGSGTSNINTDKTWDDYGKYNEIPGHSGGSASGSYGGAGSSGPRLTKDEQDKEKYKMIREMEDWERKSNGKIQLSKKYTMESPFHEIKIEYDALKEEAGKKASVKFQGSCMKMLINGIEFLNDKFDPFDVNLEGWGDKVDEEMDQYDDIFGQLYDKYQHRGSIAPELKLMFQLGGSAFMVNLTNKIFKNAGPGVEDIFRQDPELMRNFQNSAIRTMGQNNPGVGNFMSGLGNNGQQGGASGITGGPNGLNGRPGGPPPPVPTQGQYADPPPLYRGGNNTRPDLAAARGVQARESGPLQAREPYLPNQQQAPSRAPGPRNVPAAQQHASNNSAMNLALGGQNDRGATAQTQDWGRSARRPATNRPETEGRLRAETEGRLRAEMRGPSDMSDLLSGIKTRTIEKPMTTAPMVSTTNVGPISITQDDNVSQMSTETMSVLTTGVTSVGGTKKPRKPRKSKSDKNTVSMDL